jgi:hypothetical protein
MGFPVRGDLKRPGAFAFPAGKARLLEPRRARLNAACATAAATAAESRLSNGCGRI